MQLDWRSHLKNNFTNWEKLADFLQLEETERNFILKKPRFVLNLPLRLAQKIQKKTLNDPILKQFLPVEAENLETVGFKLDPTGDTEFRKSPKLLHKYAGRALIVTTSACAMHCRFCFRQNFPYETERKAYDEELLAIQSDKTIKEVILSGGDPLSLSNEVLKGLFSQLESFDHVKRIRFHTRFPIGIPERIDESFVSLIERSSCQIYFVLHCNHAKELDEDILERMKRLQKAGAVLLNQAVLLQGVNDTLEDLYQLSEKLVDHGILPYYLHQLDQVQGTSHFEVSEDKGRELIMELTKKLSGYAIPKYVREIPHQASKTNLFS